MWRRLVKAKTTRQPPVWTGDRHEREWTDLPVGGIEGRAVPIEGLAEALRVQGSVARRATSAAMISDVIPPVWCSNSSKSRRPLSSVAKVCMPTLTRIAPSPGRFRDDRVPERAEDGGRAGVHEIDTRRRAANRVHAGHAGRGSV